MDGLTEEHTVHMPSVVSVRDGVARLPQHSPEEVIRSIAGYQSPPDGLPDEFL